MYEKQISRTYFRELYGSIFVYLIVLFVSIWIAKDMADGATRTLIALCPLLPVLGMFWAVVRHLKRLDEFQRQLTVESAALAGGLTAFFSLTYGFLEGVGFPKLSMFIVWGVFMIAWGVLPCVRRKMER